MCARAPPAKPWTTRARSDEPHVADRSARARRSGSATEKLNWMTTVTGVMSSARSDRQDAIAAALRGMAGASAGNNNPGGPNNQPPGTPGAPGMPGSPIARHLCLAPSLHRRRHDDAPRGIHAHRSGDRDLHRGGDVRHRLPRAQPGDGGSRGPEHLAAARQRDPAWHAHRRAGLRADRRARARATRRATANCGPAISANDRDNTLVTFTRTGWSNPAGVQRPAEQRVRYRFIDGSLVREHWLSVDPALNGEPLQRVLLTRVKSVEVRFLDPVTRNWRNDWPAARGHGSRRATADRRDLAARGRWRSSSRWCSMTGAGCSVCSRFPRDAVNEAWLCSWPS